MMYVAMEYYLAIRKKKKKNKKILPFATTWVDDKGIMLCEIRERKTMYNCLYMASKQSKITTTTKSKLINYREQTGTRRQEVGSRVKDGRR